MKNILFLLSLAAASLLVASCQEKSTADVGMAADVFAQRLMAEDYVGAYRDSSMNFRTRTNFDDFSFRANRLRAAPKSTVNWSEPREENGEVMLSGTFPREEGATGKINLTLMREIDEWKVSKFDVE